MTTELQRAMARYEEARVQYKKAVLASLNGASNGDAIRHAIQSFQRASSELKRLQGSPAPAAPQQRLQGSLAPAAPKTKQRQVPELFAVWGFMRRLLRAG